MKTKLGKISIGCFIATLIVPMFLVMLLMKVHPADSWTTLPELLIGLLTVLFIFLMRLSGTVCAIIGAVKKERPKAYYIVGLVLNLTSFFRIFLRLFYPF